MKRTPRRPLQLLVTAGVAAAMLLSGCGGGTKAGQTAQTSDGKGEVKGNIQVAWWGGDSRNAKTNAVIDMFEKKNAGVTTERQSADFAKYFDRLNVQASSKSLPCAVQMQGRQVNDYVKRQVLMPLDDMIAAGTINVSDIPPAVLAAGKGTDGKTYFVPYGAAYDSVAFNKTLAEKAGVGVPDPSYDWDAFVTYLKKAKAGLPEGKYVVGNSGGATGPINAWTQANGIEMFGKDGKLGFTKEQLTEFWNIWIDLQKEGITVPPAKAAEQPVGPDQGYLATGDVMVDFIPGNALANAQKTLTGRKGGELTSLNYPVGSAGSGNAIFASGFGISSNCDNVPTAAAFINFFTNDPEAGKSFASDNGAATNSKVLDEQLKDTSLPALKKQELALYQTILKNDPPVIAFPPGFNAAFQQSFLRNYDEASFGRKTVEQAVDAFFTETNATLG
jgi:multiple sugar transport system substrate-binding protein